MFWLNKSFIEYVGWFCDIYMKEICNDYVDKFKCYFKLFVILFFCGLFDLFSNVLFFGFIVLYLFSEIGWLNENIDLYYLMILIKKRKNKWILDLVVR